MRAVVQRVSEASVSVENQMLGEIGPGLVILLGVSQEDSDRDIEYLTEKIINLRIFEDDNGKMNLSLLDVKGSLLIVSQFTLYGDCRRGRRPSYDKAAAPEDARVLYDRFVQACRNTGVPVESGRFQATMRVKIFNEGPVTLLLDSKKEF